MRAVGRDYAYQLPASAIAQKPRVPRDATKLLVVTADGVVQQHATFRDLPVIVPSNAVLVLNDTKVEPARLMLRKATGGRVEFLVTGQRGHIAHGLTNRHLAAGEFLQLGLKKLVFLRQVEGQSYFRVPWPTARLWSITERYGQTPLPPYLKKSPLSEARRRIDYQSIFAQHAGSAAAPTASLHFTKRLLSALRQRGIAIEYVTLHVGPGTFAPVTTVHLQSGKLHQEQYAISVAAAARLNRARREGRPIIAVGTTVARTLEFAARRGRLHSGSHTTSIFIRPGYRWQCVDGLITNFHIPESSLLMLVASLIGRTRLLRIYRSAVKKSYAFLSFGDGMMILPKKKRS